MEKELQKIQYPRGTQDYSKSRMRENRKYGSVRGGQSNLIPSTRLPPRRGKFAHRPALELISISRVSTARISPFGVASEHDS
jgi:hypothetical protein